MATLGRFQCVRAKAVENYTPRRRARTEVFRVGRFVVVKDDLAGPPVIGSIRSSGFTSHSKYFTGRKGGRSGFQRKAVILRCLSLRCVAFRARVVICVFVRVRVYISVAIWALNCHILTHSLQHGKRGSFPM